MEPDEKITLDEAVEEIAARRELYGRADCAHGLAAQAMGEATNHFMDGDDELAIIYRDVSKWLSAEATKLLDEWQRVNKNNQTFVEIVARYSKQ